MGLSIPSVAQKIKPEMNVFFKIHSCWSAVEKVSILYRAHTVNWLGFRREGR